MRTYAPNADKEHHFRLTPTADCVYSSDESKLTGSAANGGRIEMCFGNPAVLRVRCSGIGFTYDATDLFKVERIDADEYAIKLADDTTKYRYKDFDACAADASADYEKWLAMYPPVNARYEPMKRLAVYMIWICQIAPKGKLKEPAILFTKPTEQACFSWHQVYHAMLMNDPECAAQTLMNLFQNQDEFGELPDLVDDRYVNITATKPPFHGYGLLYLLERIGDKFTEQQLRSMYTGLERLFGFWAVMRDTDEDGVPQYNHGCESGYDFSAMFAKGVPVETPDIISYMILLAEGLGELASRLNMAADAREWRTISLHLLHALTTEFWTGERFIARLSGTHEEVIFDELEAFLPLMLGERLPKNIVERLASDLANPDKYWTPWGLRSAPKRVGQSSVIMGFSQIKILPGLYKAGYRELAANLLRGFCDYGAEHTPGFLFVAPEDGFEGDFGGEFGELSALSGAIWLGCAAFLEEMGES
jgi:hypothetical protein